MQLSKIGAMSGLLLLLGSASQVFASVSPDVYYYRVLVDTDNNQATGCGVQVHELNFSGIVPGIERLVVAIVHRLPMTANVFSIQVRNCISGMDFTDPAPFDPGVWPVGLEVGVDVGAANADVVEFYVPRAALGDPDVMRLGFHATRGAMVNDVLLTTNGQDDGQPITFGRRTATPTLSLPLLIGSAATLMVLALWSMRRGRRAAVTFFVVLGVVTSVVTAWALTITSDGDISDWSGVPPIATDVLGDSSIGDPAEDIAAAFVARDAQNVYFRMDQVNLAPTVCGNGIVEAGEQCDTDFGCPPAQTCDGGCHCVI